MNLIFKGNIDKGKKDEWLKANGGDLAMQLLDAQIDKQLEIAEEQNLRSKDTVEIDSNDVVANDVVATDVVVETTTVVDDNTVVELETEQEKNEIQEEQTPVNATVKSFVLENPTEFINLLFTEVIEPLRKEVNDLKAEVETLRKDFSINNKDAKAVNVDIEVVPTSSLAALLKERMSPKQNDFGDALESNDPLLTAKPKEFVANNESKGAFANFMTGF